MQKNKPIRSGKEIVGSVVSDKMQKTIVVKVKTPAVHPVFKKRINRFNKFKVHDPEKKAQTGDLVLIKEYRPVSREKRWKLVEVIKKAE